MIVTVPMYRVVCDAKDCKTSAQDAGEYVAWREAGTALDEAMESDWWSSEDGKRQLCSVHAPSQCDECEKKHESEMCP